MDDLSNPSLSCVINSLTSLKGCVFRAYMNISHFNTFQMLNMKCAVAALVYFSFAIVAPVPLSCCHPLSAPPHFFHQVVTLMSLHTLPSILAVCSAGSLSLFCFLPAVLSACLSVSLHDVSLTPSPFSQIQAFGGGACVCAHTHTHTYMGMCDLISSHLRFSKSDSSQGYL